MRRRKFTVLSTSFVLDNKIFKSCRFGNTCENGIRRFSDSPIPTQATTKTRKPAFHSSSPVVPVQVIVEMGTPSSFAIEVSDCSEFTGRLRRVVNALRDWQIWASKHSPPFPIWNTSAYQLGEYLISADKRGPTMAKGTWTKFYWVKRELGRFS